MWFQQLATQWMLENDELWEFEERDFYCEPDIYELQPYLTPEAYSRVKASSGGKLTEEPPHINLIHSKIVGTMNLKSTQERKMAGSNQVYYTVIMTLTHSLTIQ